MAATNFTRLGTILLVAGISLSLATLFRGSNTYAGLSIYNIPSSGWQICEEQFWSPRNLRLAINAGTECNIYVLDETGIELWRKTGEIASVFAFENTKKDRHTVTLNRRGKYALLICNPSSSKINVRIDWTFYGFENDLILLSAGMVLTGIMTIVVQRILSLLEQKTFEFSRTENSHLLLRKHLRKIRKIPKNTIRDILLFPEIASHITWTEF